MSTDAQLESRLGLNDNKAGMEGLDKDKINKIILQASKGSLYYRNELKKDSAVTQRIAELKKQLDQASPAQLASCIHKADMLLDSLRKQTDFKRYIVHVDMDAFYAAVEMRENPKLKDIPMAVGGESMLSTSNYLARRYGVRAAMPGFIARKLCPQLVIVPLNFGLYRAVSKQIRQIMQTYDKNVSSVSLDEAYLDFTEHLKKRSEFCETLRTFPEFSESMCRCEPMERIQSDRQDFAEEDGFTSDEDRDICKETVPATELPSKENISVCLRCGKQINPCKIMFGFGVEDAVKEMRHRIHLKTCLTASAGIAANCLLAKICSDKNKPNGQYLLPFNQQAVQDFLKDLPIRKVPGIGKVSEKQLTAFEVTTCKDFFTHRDKLCFLFSGQSLEYFMSVYLGLGSNVVCRSEEGPKSKSVERTFGKLSDAAALLDLCHELSIELAEDLKSSDLYGKTVTLKVKLVTFELKTRAHSLTNVTNDGEEIYKVASNLLKTEMKLANPKPLSLRLMGVRMSNFSSASSKKSKVNVKKSFEKKCVNGEVSVSNHQDETVTIGEPPSFFDLIERERPKLTNDTDTQSLGLLAYMSAADRKEIDNKHSIKNNKHSLGLQRFSKKRKFTWDDIENDASEKLHKPGTKHIIPTCYISDSNSNSSAVSADGENNQYPVASTPSRHSKSLGPLDHFASTSHNKDLFYSPISSDGVKDSTRSRQRGGKSNSRNLASTPTSKQGPLDQFTSTSNFTDPLYSPISFKEVTGVQKSGRTSKSKQGTSAASDKLQGPLDQFTSSSLSKDPFTSHGSSQEANGFASSERGKKRFKSRKGNLDNLRGNLTLQKKDETFQCKYVGPLDSAITGFSRDATLFGKNGPSSGNSNATCNSKQQPFKTLHNGITFRDKYLKKTKSPWEELLDFDGDIICLDDVASSKSGNNYTSTTEESDRRSKRFGKEEVKKNIREQCKSTNKLRLHKNNFDNLKISEVVFIDSD